MRKRKRLLGVLFVIVALIIMTLPVSEADAASSASDFVMDGSTLVKYRGTEKNVSVPDTVEVIGKSAFEDKTGIELVVLPNSVKRVEAYAFWGCDNLDTVVLGKGLTEVGDYAFAGCKGLEQMSIPANVKSIGNQAFGDCVNLTDISIPAETVIIQESAFEGCAKLKIHCEEGSTAYFYAQKFYEKQKEMPEYEDVPGYGDESENDSGNSNGSQVTPAPAATEEPKTTEEPYRIDGDVLGTTYVVGNRAVVFIDAADLEIRQESSEPGRENNSESSENATDLTDGQPDIEKIPKYTIVDGSVVADQAYYKNSSLEGVSLQEGIEEIGEFSFARSSVTKVQIPEGVKKIAYGAFYHCDSLTEVSIPETVENVEPKAFDKTGWVEEFLQDNSSEDFLLSGGVLVAYRGDSADVTVPEGTRVIAAEVFQGHEEIESLTLPDSMRVIGEAAFEECTGLRDVRLNHGLEKIKDRAFCGDSNAVIMVPASVKEVGLRALETVTAEFEGDMPKESFETSATRLSNEAYRGITEESKETGVSVTGIKGASANLEGAARHYELSIREANTNKVLEKAWKRVTEEAFPGNMVVYETELTDSSNIPLKKLGHQKLTIILPVPEQLAGQELKAVTSDRNGQLEAVTAKRVLANGAEAICIETFWLSEFGIYGVGEASDGELQEFSVSLQASSAPPADEKNGMLITRWMIGGALLITGGLLCLPECKKRKETKTVQ